MLSFLQREVPITGRVLYRGGIPFPSEAMSRLPPPTTWQPSRPNERTVWAGEATHPEWGAAEIACFRQPMTLPDAIVDHTVWLTEAERQLARFGETGVAVTVRTRQKNVLRDRKRLLFWLQALLRLDGVIAIDDGSTLLWSLAMLDDELLHAADLDIESLYAIHAVHEGSDAQRTSWLHTHGLEELGAFDIDVLDPSPAFVSNCSDPLRALAFAALEGAIAPDTDRFTLASPGGDVRFVPVARFHETAAPEHRARRALDSVHGGRRSVLCEPASGLFGRWRTRPRPSRYLSTLDTDAMVIRFSKAASELMAERAARTLPVFRSLKEEFASLRLPAVVKLGFEVEGGGPDEREHLWFEAHTLTDETVDATLANTPHRVPSLRAGERGEHSLARLTDWLVLSPEGQMTPRNIGAARRLRENRAKWQAVVDGAEGSGTAR